jgi:hypothetical protein
MMMEAMRVGGMDLAYDWYYEGILKAQYPGINKYFYEIPNSSANLDGLVSWDLHGKAVKLLGTGPMKLSKKHWPLNIIYMVRDSDAWVASNKAARRFEYSTMQLESWQRAMMTLCPRQPYVESFAVFDYGEVVKDPKTAFQAVKDLGWPIEVELAASVVDPQLKHY